MNNKHHLEWVKSALEASAHIDPPRIDKATPEIRTGATLPGLNAARQTLNLTQGDIIVEFYIDILRNRVADFLDRLQAVDGALRAGTNMPQTVKYEGTFVEKSPGRDEELSVRFRLEGGNYADLQHLDEPVAGSSIEILLSIMNDEILVQKIRTVVSRQLQGPDQP